jgi:diguanylate cyclase (GGDEF)-like protein
MPLSDVVLHPFVAPPAHPGGASSAAPLCFADHRGPASAGPLVEHLQAHGVRVRRTRNLVETVDALAGGAHRAVLLDPLGVGPTELLAALAAAPSTPLLLVVEPGQPEASLGALEQAVARRGALIDVVHRGASALEIALRLGALERAAAWRHRASHDERTECLRPEAFEARLAEAHSAARRHRHPLALAVLDLDDFGSINKSHDHTVGDGVIARVGQVLRASLRTEDLAGRVGGDEFALALPFTDLAEAVRCTERVLVELARAPVPGRDGARVHVTASAGVAALATGEEAPLKLIRRRAELALKRAKEAGGNRATAWRERAAEDSLAVAE